ncbi:hypothetical protein RHO13_01605 [Orbus wheelerorum]|uniref:hypothetical protein n=1 Tax=Orbus wheelerorum TaxID=3074111 RepID=UPI00370D1E44
MYEQPFSQQYSTLSNVPYNCYFNEARFAYGNSAEDIMNNFDNKIIREFNVEVVDKIDFHILYMAEFIEE